MLEHNVDSLLSLVARVAWLLFAIYAVVYFVRTVFKHGIVLALIRLFSFRILGPLLVVIGLGLLSLALVFIRPQEVGVVVSVASPGGIRPQPLRSGLHWIVPFIEQEVRYPVYWQTYTMSGKPREGQELGDDSIRARTSDGQEVRLDISVIFRLKIEQAVSIHTDWQNRYIQEFVRPVVRGFVRTQVSQFTVSEVNSSQRKDLEATLDRLLQEEFADKGLVLDQFLLRDITFSTEYANSIEQKQVAQEGRQKTEHEAQQMRNLAEGRRDQYKLEAAGEAEAILIRAQAQAAALKLIAEALELNPSLVTYRYVEKLSPNIRVMLVPSNAPFILPLPTLEAPEPMTSTAVTTSSLLPLIAPIATPPPPSIEGTTESSP